MDTNLQQLLEAWFSGEADNASIRPLIERLKSDEDFRKAFIAELAMNGQLKAVQASEPRWLKLEDILSSAGDNEIVGESLESRVMKSLSDARSRRRLGKQRTLRLATTATLAMAASILAAMFWHGGLNDKTVPERQRLAQDTVLPTGSSQSQLAVNSVTGFAEHGSFAVLSHSVNAKWGGDRHPATGDLLGRGNLVLQRGTIQIDFLAGVRMLVRAPADIELRAFSEVMLRHGSASCFVTKMGHGFRVVTGEFEVIDLGTSFSVEVTEGRAPEVHVLEGAVEIKSPQQAPFELREEHAVRMEDNGVVSVAYSPDRFPSLTNLQNQQRFRDNRRYERWQEYAKEISKDPAVVLHYTFEETDPIGLVLNNEAADPSQATDGVVIGCQWANGRWPSKRSLRYRNENDRVMFQVPGFFDELTFMVWARVDALTQPTTSLLMTEHPGRRLQFAPAKDETIDLAMERLRKSQVKTVRWEFSHNDSDIMFNVGYGDGERRKYDLCSVDSETTLPRNWGDWVCLAVTCDTTRREVIHYLNGRSIGSCSLENSEPLLLDFMELGNFGVSRQQMEDSGGAAQRRFYGAFDEVVIAKRVLSADEIRTFWLVGKP